MRRLFAFTKYLGIVLLGLLACIATWWGACNIIMTHIDIPMENGQCVSLSLSLQDKRNLDYFFQEAMIMEEGGYVLLGDKPMWMGVYFKPFASTSWDEFLTSISLPNLRTYYGWKTWQKYQDFFSSGQFLALEEPNPFWGEHHSNVSILLVNRANLQNIVAVYQEDFQTILGREVSGEELLQEAKTAPFLKTVLKKHEGLIGTVFGYGRNNAWLFQQRDEGKPIVLRSLWGDTISDFYANRRAKTRRWLGVFPSSLAESVGYPCCAADPTSLESEQVRQGFLKTRQKIIDYYQDKDVLEATLSLLLNGPPTTHSK
jgi:hypothetical protein